MRSRNRGMSSFRRMSRMSSSSGLSGAAAGEQQNGQQLRTRMSCSRGSSSSKGWICSSRGRSSNSRGRSSSRMSWSTGVAGGEEYQEEQQNAKMGRISSSRGGSSSRMSWSSNRRRGNKMGRSRISSSRGRSSSRVSWSSRSGGEAG